MSRSAGSLRPHRIPPITGKQEHQDAAPNDAPLLAPLHTGLDVINYYSRQASSDSSATGGNSRSLAFVICVRADTGLEFRPYDLTVVKPGEPLNADTIFVISSVGVVTLRNARGHNHAAAVAAAQKSAAAGQPAGTARPLHLWLREATAVDRLRMLPLFRRFVPLKAFRAWRESAKMKRFLATRDVIASRLLSVNAAFAGHLATVSNHCHGIVSHPLIVPTQPSAQLQRQEFVLGTFIDQQTAQRADATAAMATSVDSIESTILTVCDAVASRTALPDLHTAEALEQYLLRTAPAGGPGPSAARALKGSMVGQRQLLHRRKVDLKRALADSGLLPEFITLADTMAAEAVIQNVLRSYDALLHAVGGGPSASERLLIFQIALTFPPNATVVPQFSPDSQTIVGALSALASDTVAAAAALPRVVMLRSLRRHFPLAPTVVPVPTVVLADNRWTGLAAAIDDTTGADFAAAAQHAKPFATYRQLYVFVHDEWPAIKSKWVSTPGDVPHTEYVHCVRRVRQSLAALERLYNKPVGCLLIYAQRLRAELQPMLHAVLSDVRESLLGTTRIRTTQLHTDMHQRLRQLRERPRQLDQFATFAKALKAVLAEEARINTDADELDGLHSLVDDVGAQLTQEDIVRRDRLLGGGSVHGAQSMRVDFTEALQQAQEYRSSMLKHMTLMLDERIESVNEKLLSMTAHLREGDFVASPSDVEPSAVLDQLAVTRTALDQITETIATYTEYQKLFDTTASELSSLHTMERLFKTRDEIWTRVDRWHTVRHQWGVTPISQLDATAIKSTVNEFLKKATALHRESRDEVTSYLLDSVKAEKAELTIIADLCNPNLQREHWVAIFHGMHKPYMPDTAYTLENLRQWSAFDHGPLISEQSAIASGEASLRESLQRVIDVWETLNLPTKGYRDSTTTFILSALEEIMLTLEDNQMTLQSTLASRYVAGVRSQVEEWVSRLQLVSDVLDEWVAVQRQWIYLEFIFSSDDIQAALPDESRRFANISKLFSDLTARAHRNPNCLANCAEVSVLHNLRDSNEALEYIQKRLEEYLDAKRVTFPRFYFLANDELLLILSDVRNPQSVQPHLGKCFDGVHRLVFTGPRITAMRSVEGEVVPLSQPVAPDGAVEVWLGKVEAAMRRAVGDHLQAAAANVAVMPRGRWIEEFPSQCVQVVDLVTWTAGVELALKEAESLVAAGEAPSVDAALQPLAAYAADYDERISEIVQIVQQPSVSAQMRQTLTTLIVLMVHARSVVQSLLDNKVASTSDHNWALQLRYSVHSGTVFVDQLNASFAYANEYLGNAPRLVVTPLTDRCYLTLTGALHLHLGGAPQGPAGTGKTETVKDLGKALARQVVVFNCSDGLDWRILARMFSGLACAGAWACFDEFNRIDVEVLSVVAQQMLDLTTALASGVPSLMFEGKQITMSPNFGVFITMNPGYAGRTELPDNLKVLFRPVCMMIPDYALIAEISLYSEGFLSAGPLSRKMAQLYRLSSEQLSKQDHYDFGMRAVKSILVMAGALRRADPTTPEDTLLIRAMRDSNIPKFLGDDAALFMALVRDLFPTAVVEDHAVSHIEPAVRRVCEVRALQPTGGFIEKCDQLAETLRVRHGLMVVGSTLTGKSTTLRVLADAFTALSLSKDAAADVHYRPVVMHGLNPKAVTMGDLYGDLDDVTREWNDGLLARIVRDIVSGAGAVSFAYTGGDAVGPVPQPTVVTEQPRHWIHLDGPVDAIWIENLNTVLDDNKMLCLANGERIKLPNTVTFCFEVEDLLVASPATVSRCGMLYFEPVVLSGWRAQARSALADVGVRLAAQSPAPAVPFDEDAVFALMETTLDVAFAHLKKDGAQHIHLTEARMALSVVQMLEALIVGVGVDPDIAAPTATSAAVAAEEDDEAAEDQLVEEREADAMVPPVDATRPIIDTMPAMRTADERPASTLLPMLYSVAFVWGVGGCCTEASRAKFNAAVSPVLRAAVPALGHALTTRQHGIESVYDVAVHAPSRSFVPWTAKMAYHQTIPGLPFFDNTVSTVEHTVANHMLTALIRTGRNVMFVGQTGTGKSQVITDYVRRNLNDNWLIISQSLSARTTAKMLLELFESRLQRRRAGAIGPAPGHRCALFIDDMHLPAPEEYGAIPPLELLRQVIGPSSGYWDRKKHIYKNVLDTVALAAAAPSTGRRPAVPPRLASLFVPLVTPQLSRGSLERVFYAILRGFVLELPFAAAVRRMAADTVNVIIDVYTRMVAEMRPLPSTTHYVFNLRDVAKVVHGILMATPQHCSTPAAFAHITCHETARVFFDRLVSDADRTRATDFLQSAVKANLGRHGVAWQSRLVEQSWGDFLEKEDHSVYRPLPPPAELSIVLREYLLNYQLDTGTETVILFFEQAVNHVCRIARVLRQPRGSMLLIGVAGTGRRTLARIASYVADVSVSRVYSLNMTKKYKLSDFRDDLKRAVLEAGCERQASVFLLSDDQVLDESMLEIVNTVLNVGDAPGLIASEDMERIGASLASELGSNTTRVALLNTFVRHVRTHLHVILCMSPVGDKFRTRLANFPALVSCCVIDWFDSWSNAALANVAEEILGDDVDRRDLSAVAKVCIEMHHSAAAVSKRFSDQSGLRVYLTPTSYLELVRQFQVLLKLQKAKLQSEISRFVAGVEKLESTFAATERMRTELKGMQPGLEQASKDAEVFLVQLEKDREAAAKTRAVCEAEEASCSKINMEAAAIKDDCQAELDRAMPAYYSALEALKHLSKKDIDELKTFKQPPDQVRLTMDAVLLLLGEKQGWDSARKVMSDMAFLQRLEKYDKDNVPTATLRKLQKWIDDPSFKPELIKASSLACMSMCMWVHAIDHYSRVAKDLVPKRAAAAAAEEKLHASRQRLAEKRQELAAVEAKLARLEKSYEDAIGKRDRLKADIDTTEQRLVRAVALIEGLSGERGRWSEEADRLRAKVPSLIGEVLLASGVLAYSGPFTAPYRDECIKAWTRSVRAAGLRVEDGFHLESSIADPVLVREWVGHKLPSDAFSIENALIVTRAARWPYVIDPQGQANAWIRSFEKDNGLIVVRPAQPTFLRTLENAMKTGQSVLVESAGESFDPTLDDLLARNFKVQSSRRMLQFGDQDIAVDMAFKLYITSRIPIPHLLPSLQIKVGVVNFAVTTDGLAEQLLADVVAAERPDLEAQKARTVATLATARATLKAGEDAILYELGAATGNILDNEALIKKLQAAKASSTAVNKTVAEAEETDRATTTARDVYRPLAERGAVLYQTVSGLAGLDCMYSNSLAFFKQIFLRTINNAPKSDVPVTTRITSLMEATTRDIYGTVARGLFEQHRLTFAFALAGAIGVHDRTISAGEWSALSAPIPDASEATQGPSWLQPSVWATVDVTLAGLPAFAELPRKMLAGDAVWRAWHGAAAPEETPVPPASYPAGTLSPIQEYLLVQALRPDRGRAAARVFVQRTLGAYYASSLPFDLTAAFNDAGPTTPLLFILSSGSDPTALFLGFAAEQGLKDRCVTLSLGQDQGPRAEKLIDIAAAEGNWVYLQNCHLATSWMPALEALVDSLATREPPLHPDFRLWLSSMPSATFPAIVLQQSIKLTREPPRGLKANVSDCLSVTLRDMWDLGTVAHLPTAPDARTTAVWHRMLFMLSWLHATTQERRAFGTIGWNVPYEWNAGDLLAAAQMAAHYVVDSRRPRSAAPAAAAGTPGGINWDALEYVLTNITYGGRVTDFLDHRCLGQSVRGVTRESSLDAMLMLTDDSSYAAPPGGSGLQQSLAAVAKFPDVDDPSAFGLHANARIAAQLADAQRFKAAIRDMQGAVGGVADDPFCEGSAAALGDAIETLNSLLADPISIADIHPKSAERTASGAPASLTTVLFQEVAAANKLRAVIRGTLDAIQAVLRGDSVADEATTVAARAVVAGRVPPTWLKLSASLRPLGVFFSDFVRRVEFFREWVDLGPPSAFWLSGFSFPQGFLTAVLQRHARATHSPIDELRLRTIVTGMHDASAITGPPDDGVYVYGLHADGAAWDFTQQALVDSKPGVLQAPLPVIQLVPESNLVPELVDDNVYQCPLYRTSARAGALSTTGISSNFVTMLRLPSKQPGSHWVRRGTAALCQLDDR